MPAASWRPEAFPFISPSTSDPAAVGERLDGIVLSGGTDIDPARYGADPHPELLTPEQERDDLELGLLSAALDADVPVLGICRGIQIVNVHQGGTLHQHVPEHGRFDLPIDTAIHQVSFAEGSILGELYGPSAEVNSLHHQTVDQLGRDLTVTAKSDDGTIEGLEMGRSSGRRPVASRDDAHPPYRSHFPLAGRAGLPLVRLAGVNEVRRREDAELAGLGQG